MITRLAVLLLLPVMALSVARAQTVTRISEEGTFEALGVEVKFNSPVINPEKGVQYATLDDIGQEYGHIRDFLEQLAARYGEFDLIKQLPNEVWGDTLIPRVTDRVLVPVADMSQLYYLRFSDWIPVDEVLEQILYLSEVEYAHPPVEAVSLADPPNDPLYEDQWNLVRIAAENAWQITHGNESITVAIIESENLPYKLHPDLVNKWDPNKGEQGSGGPGHGTLVAGIIGAETNNEIGIASLGRNLKMSRYFFFYQEPEPVFLAAQIDSARAQGNRVINCSFLTIKITRIAPTSPCWIRKPWNYSSVRQAIERAIAAQVIVVGGYGNSLAWLVYREPCTVNELVGEHFPFQPYPAAYDGAIAVSATGANDLWAEGQNLNDPWQYYNYGSFVAVAAPGMNVLTTSGSNGYNDGERGTSFSAPHVSALAGLILSIDSTLTPLAVKDIITSTADKVDSVRFPYTNGWNSRLGHGRINAYRALSKANGPPSAPQNFQVTTHWENWTAHPKLTWGGAQEPDVLDGGKYRIWRRILYQGIEPWELHDSVTGTATQYIDYSVSYAGSGMYTARYKVKAVDFADLESAFSDSGQVQFGNVWKTGEQDSSATIPGTFELNQNFPNPFNPSTAIRYALPVDIEVSIKVIDLLGREVVTLVSGFHKAGKHTVVLDARFLPSGVYFYQMKAGAFTSVKKLLLLR